MVTGAVVGEANSLDGGGVGVSFSGQILFDILSVI